MAHCTLPPWPGADEAILVMCINVVLQERKKHTTSCSEILAQ